MPAPFQAVASKFVISGIVTSTGAFGDCGYGATFAVTSCSYKGRDAVMKTIRTSGGKDDLSYGARFDNFLNSVLVFGRLVEFQGVASQPSHQFVNLKIKVYRNNDTLIPIL